MTVADLIKQLEGAPDDAYVEVVITEGDQYGTWERRGQIAVVICSIPTLLVLR